MIDTADIEAQFGVLGLAPGATADAVKEAYKHHVQAFHPDRFPAGSTAQSWASEKLVQINQANDKLKAFFKECPDGVPPGGWSSKKDSAAGAAAGADADAADSSGSMDWQKWKNSREEDMTDDLANFVRYREGHEAGRVKEHGKGQRRSILTNAKAFSAVILVIFFFGRGCSAVSGSAEAEREINNWAMQYGAQPTMTGGFVFPPGMSQDAVEHANEERRQIERHFDSESAAHSIGQIIYFALVGFWCWMVFARRPRQIQEDWVETGVFSWSGLETAARETAIETAQKLKPAADAIKSKAEDAAVKLKPAVDIGAAKAKIMAKDFMVKAKQMAKDTETAAATQSANRSKPEQKTEQKSTPSSEKPQEKPKQGTQEMLDELLKREKQEAETKRKSKPAPKNQQKDWGDE